MKHNPIISNYDHFEEEQRAFGSRADQIEFIYTKRLLDFYIDSSKTVLELGCGTGYYGLYLSEKCKSYQGIDLVPKHIKQFQKKIVDHQLPNVQAAVGDATHLPEIQENTYDIVLVFGPMYHLQLNERKKVIAESKRVCKEGGLILFAYINKVGAYLRACFDDDMKVNYPNAATNHSVFVEGIDDHLPDVFYFTMPEEMVQDATDEGLTVVRNAGVDFSFNPTGINSMDEEKYAVWTEIMDYMYNSSSCAGTSNHAVLVCRK